MDIHTENFIRRKLLRLRAIIAEAQQTRSRCDFELAMDLNALREMVILEIVRDRVPLEATIPRIDLVVIDGLGVAPERALSLHDALIDLLDLETQRRDAGG